MADSFNVMGVVLVIKPGFLVALLNIFLLLMGGCASTSYYFGESISGTVYDEVTDEPIQGVVVSVNWELIQGMGNYPVEQIEVMEAVTDKDGNFSFPDWGPTKSKTTGNISFMTPVLRFVSDSYEVMVTWEDDGPSVEAQAFGRPPYFYRRLSSKFSGQRFNLRPLVGSYHPDTNELSQLKSALDLSAISDYELCRKIPKTFAAVERIRESILAHTGELKISVYNCMKKN